jgi:transposase InsO family protein
LAEISVAHLYNLRGSAAYRQRAAEFTRTAPSGVAIGERRRPDPQGVPGYLRVDTVHQGDWEDEKGVYHINAVDTVTQWEIVGCAERISEQHLLPVLEAMLHQFPFRILGFHADNGSEYVNYRVAEMLGKLMVEFTRSRPNRSSDNALVEGKNGAIVRKNIGYGYIASEHAERIQAFYTAHFNPYLNYHRPCGFAQVRLDPRGRRRRSYPTEDYATPYEKLRSLPEAYRHLKQDMRWELLDRIAYARSDTAAALQMAAAKAALLQKCKSESPFPPRFAC